LSKSYKCRNVTMLERYLEKAGGMS
jgi:hypothetical protein